jgi:Flp pilus assembly protein TadG
MKTRLLHRSANNRHRIRNTSTNRRGATTVEFALVAPIIFALFLGAIELTRMNFLRHTAANVAYEAARASIVPGAGVADGQAEAMQLLSMVGADNNVNVNINVTATTVQATVTIPVSANSWSLGRFTSNLNIVQTCRLRRELTQ